MNTMYAASSPWISKFQFDLDTAVKPSLVKWENNIFKHTLPMSSWSYKVKTAVYSGVKDVSSIEA